MVDPDTGEQVPGHYVVGWIKRGPSGVIGTNKKDAADTVASIFEDVEAGRFAELRPDAADRRGLSTVARGDHVTYMGWRAIDAAEQAAGEPHGRPRVKFCRVHEMVEASRQGVAG